MGYEEEDESGVRRNQIYEKRRRKMKKYLSLLLIMFMMLNIVPVSAAVFDSDIFLVRQKRDVPYNRLDCGCYFEVKLPDDWRNTWVYDISDNGHLDVAVERRTLLKKDSFGNLSGVAVFGLDVYVTLKGKEQVRLQAEFLSSDNFGSNGHYVIRCESNLEENTYYDYGFHQESEEYQKNLDYYIYTLLRLNMTITYGVKEIEMYMADDHQSRDARETSIVTPIWDTYEEKEPSGYMNLFDEDGETAPVYQPTVGSDEYYKAREEAARRAKEYEEAWADPEKSVKLFGKYKDDNGTIRTVKFLKGDFFDSTYDYQIEVAASFQVKDKMSPLARRLSTHGNLNVTFLSLKREKDGKPLPLGIVLLKVSGNKGTQWFQDGDMEVIPPNPAVESTSTHLKDDSSIYMSFRPIYKMRNDLMVYGDEGAVNDISITFRYNDHLKTVLKDLMLDFGGSQCSVPVGEIDYKGGFLTFFLRSVYPDNWKEVAEELGVTL